MKSLKQVRIELSRFPYQSYKNGPTAEEVIDIVNAERDHDNTGQQLLTELIGAYEWAEDHAFALCGWMEVSCEVL
jgi:hypothetical protein